MPMIPRLCLRWGVQNSKDPIDEVKERDELISFLRKEGPWKHHRITLNHLLGAIKKVHEVSGKKLPVVHGYHDQDTILMNDLLYDVSLLLTYWEVYNLEIAANLQGLVQLAFSYITRGDMGQEDDLIFPAYRRMKE